MCKIQQQLAQSSISDKLYTSPLGNKHAVQSTPAKPDISVGSFDYESTMSHYSTTVLRLRSTYPNNSIVSSIYLITYPHLGGHLPRYVRCRVGSGSKSSVNVIVTGKREL